MNVFQRTGIFVFRVLAIAMVGMAIMGGCMYGVHVAQGTVDPLISAKAAAAVEWFVAGLVLLVLSKSLGKFVGAGLG